MDVYLLWGIRDGEPERLHAILRTAEAAERYKAALDANDARLVPLGWHPWRFRVEPFPCEER